MKNGLEKGSLEGKEAVVVIQGRDAGAEGTKRNGWGSGKTRITGSDDKSHGRRSCCLPGCWLKQLDFHSSHISLHGFPTFLLHEGQIYSECGAGHGPLDSEFIPAAIVTM